MDYEHWYSSYHLHIGRAVLGRLSTGQDYYAYSVKANGDRRYFKNGDGYNGNRVERFLQAHHPALWQSEGRDIHLPNWKS